MNRTAICLVLLSSALVYGFTKLTNQQVSRFEVPEGFVVEEVAGDDEVGSIAAFTFDNRGRIVIAKEFGDIAVLVPRADGTFEQRVVSDEISNSQGIVYDGPDLLAMSEGPEGVALYRVVDEDGDGRGERVELVESVNRRIEDHGPHAPIWGPDGHLYWMMANVASIYEKPAVLSPVRSYHWSSLIEKTGGFGGNYYRTPEGVVYRNEIARNGGTGSYVEARTAAHFSDWELYSMGHRNAYDFSFNLIGELFTYDSDHEPDLEMPWYRPTYSTHILPGGEYGYREGSALHPSYYFDDAPMLEDLGRGSPTGVVTYLAYNYPEEYWDVPLFADWSRGRILMSKLTKNGASYTPETSNFVYGTPLNVTDVEVGPDGNVYFSLGGRDTQGGVYRVVYNGPDAMERPEADTPIEEVLTMVQPRSAFSRQKAQDVKDEIGEQAWREELTAVATDTDAPAERRIRAMELLAVFGPGMEINTLRSLADDASWEVRASTAYYLGMNTRPAVRLTLIGMLDDEDAFVQRRAAEGLLRTGLNPAIDSPLSPVENVFPLLRSEDASVRFAGRTLLRAIHSNRWLEDAIRLEEYPVALEALLAYVQSVGDHRDMYNYSRILNRERELLEANPTDEQLLDLVRLIQYTMTKDMGVDEFPVIGSTDRVRGGVIYQPGRGFFLSDTTTGTAAGGQRGNVYQEISEQLLDRFPSDDWRLNREITRVFAYVQTPEAIPEIVTELQAETDLKQQIHYIYMLSRFESGWEDATIEPVINWFVTAAENGEPRGGHITWMRSNFFNHIPEAQANLAMQRIEEAQPDGGGGFFGGGGAGEEMSEEAVQRLIFDPESLHGDPAGGVIAYEKAACINCHTFGPIGVNYGPDLTTLGQRFSREDIVRAIVYPSEIISSQYAGQVVTRTDGSTVSGTILQNDNETVIVQLPAGGEVTIPASEVESIEQSEVSMMPPGLMSVLSNSEREGLILLLQQGPSAIPDSALQRINEQ